MSIDELLYSLLEKEAKKEEIINLPVLTLSSDEKYDMIMSKEFIEKTNSLVVTNTDTVTNSSGKEYQKHTYGNNRIAFVSTDKAFLAVITTDKKVFDLPTLKINLNGTISDLKSTNYTSLIKEHYGGSLEDCGFELTLSDDVYMHNEYVMVPLCVLDSAVATKRKVLNDLQRDIDERNLVIVEDFTRTAVALEAHAEQINNDREVHVTTTSDHPLWEVLDVQHKRD